MTTVRVKFTDKGLAEFMTTVRAMGQTRVRAGVLGQAGAAPHPDTDLTVGEVATINEFGTRDGHVPERSFVREPLRRPGVVSAILGRAAARIVGDRANLRAALGTAGGEMVSIIKDAIARGVPPANAPATIRAKGFDHPLIDSATMFHAVNYDMVTTLEADAYDAIEITGGDE